MPPIESETETCVRKIPSMVPARPTSQPVKRSQKNEQQLDFSAFKNLSLSKDLDKSAPNNMSGTFENKDKSALRTWDNKELLPAYSSKSPAKKPLGNPVFYDEVPIENYDEMTEPKGAKPKVLQALNYSSVVSGKRSTNSPPPPLPPRAPRPQMPTSRSPQTPEIYSNVPTSGDFMPQIHPVVKDGKQVSKTHYWLLPDKDKQTAQVKPFSVSASLQNDKPYQNFYGIQNQGYQATLGPNTNPSEMRQDSNFKGLSATGGSGSLMDQSPQGAATSSSWGQITGMVAVGPNNSNRNLKYSRIPKSRQYAQQDYTTSTEQQQAAAEASMGDIKSKVKAIQDKVHGVTDEECMAALQGNQWDVDASVKYLMVEQLFRLSVATREKCFKLLELFHWNLEMAGSALLDEYSAGSAV